MYSCWPFWLAFLTDRIFFQRVCDIRARPSGATQLIFLTGENRIHSSSTKWNERNLVAIIKLLEKGPFPLA